MPGNSEVRSLNGAKLASARVGAGFASKKDFAERLGMSRQRYSAWESPRPPARFDFHLMSKALRLLKVDFETISDPVALPDSA